MCRNPNVQPKMLFCVKCFASSKDASCGGEVFKDLCCNCGAGGATIELEEWQIKSIREQASWIGKRFYPHAEDLDHSLEIKYARQQLPIPDNRHAHHCLDAEGAQIPHQYWVTQPTGKSSTSVIIEASSKEEALEKSRTLLPLKVA